MKIKRFVDKDMRAVLRQVRAEQGPDAVILSNRRVDEGIEVIAAVDYDAALMQHAMGSSPGGREATAATPAEAEPLADDVTEHVEFDDSDDYVELSAEVRAEVKADVRAVHSAESIPTPKPVATAKPAVSAAPAAPVAPVAAAAPATVIDFDLTRAPVSGSSDTMLDALVGKESSLLAMRSEISSLRGLLENQVSGLLWKEGSTRSPLLAQVLRNMARLGIAPDVASMLLNKLGPVDDLKHIWQQPLAALAQLIPVTGDRLLTDGGVAALIGPTGVGKTTTIAKLAARYAMHHGTDDIALVCADAYRIGAREHLTAFANILGVKVVSVSDPQDLGRTLGALSSKKLVLIDTEGVSQRDADLTRRLGDWKQNGEGIKFYLTLSATAQEAALDETITSFSQVPLAGAVVTKVDEAGQLGCVLSALIRRQLPLAWITDGQHIPDDLHAAERRKLWLLKRAVDCIEASEPQIDEMMMAERYGKVSATHE
ncbi:MAG: flagellar biosynthesis protein FlhF [Woeseia sp.]